jgi:hypothetical protein
MADEYIDYSASAPVDTTSPTLQWYDPNTGMMESAPNPNYNPAAAQAQFDPLNTAANPWLGQAQYDPSTGGVSTMGWGELGETWAPRADQSAYVDLSKFGLNPIYRPDAYSMGLGNYDTMKGYSLEEPLKALAANIFGDVDEADLIYAMRGITQGAQDQGWQLSPNTSDAIMMQLTMDQLAKDRGYTGDLNAQLWSTPEWQQFYNESAGAAGERNAVWEKYSSTPSWQIAAMALSTMLAPITAGASIEAGLGAMGVELAAGGGMAALAADLGLSVGQLQAALAAAKAASSAMKGDALGAGLSLLGPIGSMTGISDAIGGGLSDLFSGAGGAAPDLGWTSGYDLPMGDLGFSGLEDMSGLFSGSSYMNNPEALREAIAGQDGAFQYTIGEPDLSLPDAGVYNFDVAEYLAQFGLTPDDITADFVGLDPTTGEPIYGGDGGQDGTFTVDNAPQELAVDPETGLPVVDQQGAEPLDAPQAEPETAVEAAGGGKNPLTSIAPKMLLQLALKLMGGKGGNQAIERQLREVTEREYATDEERRGAYMAYAQSLMDFIPSVDEAFALDPANANTAFGNVFVDPATGEVRYELEPGTQAYYDALMSKANEAMDQLLGADTQKMTAEEFDKAVKTLESKREADFAKLTRILYARGLLGLITYQGSAQNLITGREESYALGEGQGANPYIASYLAGIERENRELANQSRASSESYLQQLMNHSGGMLGKAVDVSNDMLRAALGLGESVDAASEAKQRKMRGLYGLLAGPGGANAARLLGSLPGDRVASALADADQAEIAQIEALRRGMFGEEF